MNMLKLTVMAAVIIFAFAASGGAPTVQAAGLAKNKETAAARKAPHRAERAKRWRNRELPQCGVRCDDVTYRGYRLHRESVFSWFPPASVAAAPFVGAKCSTADRCYLRSPDGDGYRGCDPDGCCQYHSTYYGRCNPCE